MEYFSPQLLFPCLFYYFLMFFTIFNILYLEIRNIRGRRRVFLGCFAQFVFCTFCIYKSAIYREGDVVFGHICAVYICTYCICKSAICGEGDADIMYSFCSHLHPQYAGKPAAFELIGVFILRIKLMLPWPYYFEHHLII